MKKLLFGLILLLLIPFTIIGQSRSSSDVYVKGYVKKNGTVVPGYYRSAPNNTNRDNFSTKGNINPYTGSKGHIEPDNNTRYYNYSKKNNNISYTRTTNSSSEKTNFNNTRSKFYDNEKNFKSNDSINSKYFYALEKRWIGLKNNIEFRNGNTVDEFISLNIGIKIDGGGLIMANCGDMNETRFRLDDRHKLRGVLIFYLENGEVIKCIDRKVYDRINTTDYTFYNLTRQEIHTLETNNISAIEFSVYFDYDDRYIKENKLLKYICDNFSTKWVNNKETSKQTKNLISELFKPYWLKKVEKK
jgi:hypothetical protein